MGKLRLSPSVIQSTFRQPEKVSSRVIRSASMPRGAMVMPRLYTFFSVTCRLSNAMCPTLCGHCPKPRPQTKRSGTAANGDGPCGRLQSGSEKTSHTSPILERRLGPSFRAGPTARPFTRREGGSWRTKPGTISLPNSIFCLETRRPGGYVCSRQPHNLSVMARFLFLSLRGFFIDIEPG